MNPGRDLGQLLDSKNLFRYLVEQLPNTGLILFDSELEVILFEGDDFIKKTAQVDDLTNLKVHDFLSQILGEPLQTPDESVFKDVFKGQSHAYDHMTGEECYSVYLRPLLNEADGIYAGMVVMNDITQRVRVAEKLTDQANRLKMLNHLGQIVVSQPDITEVLKEVLTMVRELISAQGVFILMEKNGRLLVEAQDEENNLETWDIEIPTTDGIAGEVWRTQESVILSGDECRAKVFESMVDSLGYTPLSFLAVPITWQEQKFGVFAAVHSQEGKFTQEDLRPVENAAAWSAIALNNAIQRQQLERRLAESEITVKLLGEILSANLSLNSVLQHVVEAGKNIVPNVDWAAIHLLDKQSNRLRLESVIGVDVSRDEYTLSHGQGVAGRVLDGGELINIGDVSQDERVASFPRTSHAGSLLVAPIINWEDVVIGTITLQSSRLNQFSGEDENSLVLLAKQAGLAIENARLYEDAERRRRVAQFQKERLRMLTHRLVTSQEEERERIARELHDEAGQSLTALNISLEILANTLPDEMQAEKRTLREACAQVESTLSNLRSIAHNLRPPALDRLGLNLALGSFCQQFESRTHIRTIYAGQELPRLPSSHEITLYRFVQEALTNIAKHADASEARVWMRSQTGQIEIHVQDNGKGIQTQTFDLERQDQEGIGLTGMQERLSIINGRLVLESETGVGAHLCAYVPLRLRE